MNQGRKQQYKVRLRQDDASLLVDWINTRCHSEAGSLSEALRFLCAQLRAEQRDQTVPDEGPLALAKEHEGPQRDQTVPVDHHYTRVRARARAHRPSNHPTIHTLQGRLDRAGAREACEQVITTWNDRASAIAERWRTINSHLKAGSKYTVFPLRSATSDGAIRMVGRALERMPDIDSWVQMFEVYEQLAPSCINRLRLFSLARLCARPSSNHDKNFQGVEDDERPLFVERLPSYVDWGRDASFEFALQSAGLLVIENKQEDNDQHCDNQAGNDQDDNVDNVVRVVHMWEPIAEDSATSYSEWRTSSDTKRVIYGANGSQ